MVQSKLKNSTTISKQLADVMMKYVLVSHINRDPLNIAIKVKVMAKPAHTYITLYIPTPYPLIVEHYTTATIGAG